MLAMATYIAESDTYAGWSTGRSFGYFGLAAGAVGLVGWAGMHGHLHGLNLSDASDLVSGRCYMMRKRSRMRSSASLFTTLQAAAGHRAEHGELLRYFLQFGTQRRRVCDPG